MRVTEARWIADQLASLPNDRISPLLNIGSSTAEFREINQPHIDRVLFAPLRERGVEVIHADLKQARGVDIHGDMMDPAIQARLRARKPRAVLSSNLLEHVLDPGAFARVIGSFVEPPGIAIITVPRSYPFHADPIDTGFRPRPDELAAMFTGFELVRGEVVADTSYSAELASQGRAGITKGLKTLIGALRPRGDIGRAQRDRLRWLFKPFTTSCVLLQAKS